MNKITIDRKSLVFVPGETILEVAGRHGIMIPHLCFSRELNSCGNCMVCAVKAPGTRNYIPACSTMAADGMNLESETEELAVFRVSALQILLAEHRGDCESPCAMVCPQELDIPFFLKKLVAENSQQSFSFNPEICRECGGKCERACRRGRVDEAIKIRELLNSLAAEDSNRGITPKAATKPYFHFLGITRAEQLVQFYQIADSASDIEAKRCLQCQCSCAAKCELRDLATAFKVQGNRFKLDSLPHRPKIVTEKTAYDPEKCIKCNRCIALGNKLTPGTGPVMSRRGIHAVIDAPVGMTFSLMFSANEEKYISVCPTGALSRP